MVSLVAHALLGIAVIVTIVRANPAIFARPGAGPRVSALEALLYAFGIASIATGWYFNVTFVTRYTDGAVLSNPLWGEGSWAQYLSLMFANPAAGSAGADFAIANVLVLPLITIIDGRRRGIRRPWLFFLSSLFVSFTFAWIFYLVAVERQRRHEAAATASALPGAAAAPVP
jgi:hypothetical protein